MFLTLERRTAADSRVLVHSYLLLTLGGNASPSASDVSELLATVDVKADPERLETLIAELNGKDINELIATGSAKLASVPSGGAAAGGAAAAAAAAGGAPAAEEKKEEKAEEKEESDDDMGFGLLYASFSLPVLQSSLTTSPAATKHLSSLCIVIHSYLKRRGSFCSFRMT